MILHWGHGVTTRKSCTKCSHCLLKQNKPNRCDTCHLNSFSCPGHCGHIELPVPVYHATFMDQLLRFLRGKCAYCNHLKLHPAEVNRFVCKLTLIRYGLLKEAAEIEEIHGKLDSPDEAESESAGDSDNGIADDLVHRRNDFVQRAIKNLGGKTIAAAIAAEKTEAVTEERRVVLREFLASITKAKSCGSCKGVSPAYRKDRYSKIFRKPLGEKDRNKMIQGGFRIVNPLVENMQERGVLQKQNGKDKEDDEGVISDFADITASESEEDADMDSEVGSQDGKLVDGIASTVVKKTKSGKSGEKESQTYVTSSEVHAAIEDLFDKEQQIMDLVYRMRPQPKGAPSLSADMFFIRHLLVPPNKFRPEAKTGEGEIAEAQTNSLYKQIINQCETMNSISKEMSDVVHATGTKKRDFNDLQAVWVRLQDAVNSLLDRDRNPIQGAAGKQNEDGIKQRLEKKEGLFRKNMMGKRVNFAARSVISPDPNIETNEIGVPPIFAKKLTYPEPVTDHNFYDLKEAVVNGVDKWPGAAAIENENGQVINLRTKNLEERQALANQLLAPSNTNAKGARNKKVHRHLNNGDVVLMNRQPTLHKPSIMGHRARILPGEKTIRMHYANCNTYNADFDGDEMNMHFPQNEIARAEALQIADTDHQYLVATQGKPLRGLIQDHISMGVWLTNRDTMFDEGDYHQLLYASLRPEDNHTLSDRIKTVAPAVMKPMQMWTGKQIVTTVLRNITTSSHPGLTLVGKSQTDGDRWGDNKEEGSVIFQAGELLCGILDKAHLGPSAGGFVHSIYETYGHTTAGKLLSVLGRLLTKLLHTRGFSCGIEDIVLTKSGNATRRQKLREAGSLGIEVATKYVTMDSSTRSDSSDLHARLRDVLHDDEKQAGLDIVYNARTSSLYSDITKACLPAGLRKSFPYNQMQTMTTSGAKGTSVNANLISCNLGQQVLEGRRVPVMISGKSLPSFKAFETDVRAGGFITNRFLTGVRPQEYYFHAMAGREGLIDTAVKTSRSGYLQRCVIKGMEGLKVEYDASVRDSDGTMVQFLYGEDGLDVTKQKHLTDFKFLAENYMSLVAQMNVQEEFKKIFNEAAIEWHKVAMRKVRKTGRIDAMDPVLSAFNPGSTLGSTSESFAIALKAYCESNPQRLLKDKKVAPNAEITKKTFNTLLDIKYMKSTVEPGEAVGIVAGQSVGEPSTQMTLNTFHLAGHSAKNVTLGIPRLREIVMTASTRISTPNMTLYPISEINKNVGERFAKGISKLTLAEVVDSVTVDERIGKGTGYETARIYNIQLKTFPSADYRETYAVDTDDILRALEYKFIPHLTKMIKKELKSKGNAKMLKESAAQPAIGKSSRAIADQPSIEDADLEGGGDEEDDDGDDDATNTKQKQNRAEAVSYDAADEDEEALASQVRRDYTSDQDMEDERISGSLGERQLEDRSSENEDQDDHVAAREREDRIKSKHSDLTHFSFDDKSGEWCHLQLEFDASASKILMLNLVESACRHAVIQSIPGISSASLVEKEVLDPDLDRVVMQNIIVTEGVNLTAMHEYQSVINPHRTMTNDIAAMLNLYGVEACRATIIREMDSVFKGHSITVDNRHLNLIADMMTRAGGFAPFNRLGLQNSVSPFMKMSFETTVGFLRDAVLQSDSDDLKGPSARIVMGKIGKVGTGAFDVLMPVA